MRQVLQNIRSGELSVDAGPAPGVRAGEVLIANAVSVISAGTEKMVMDLASKSLLGKARERPDHVRRVWQKLRTDGVASTLQAVRVKLDEPMAMGYASAGVVIGVGEGVGEFRVGDRVASNGPHAGVVSVAKHLCARVPDDVDFEHAAFTVLGAIAMQGVRLSRAAIGETAFVIGLGLVGQLSVALLRAAGCRVIGTDPDGWKCELAQRMGAEIAQPRLSGEQVEAMTGGLGADSVLICASTKSSQPIGLAAAAVRKKGRVVLIGVVGLELDRRPFYFKEAEFVVSCSYGPGRYDPLYEDRGQDYPAAYVRWTEQRNMQSVLELMGRGVLDVSPLITHRFPIERAGQAYELIEKGAERYVGIVLQYPTVAPERVQRTINLGGGAPAHTSQVGVGVLGVGNFARAVLLPAIVKCDRFRPVAICSAGGTSATHTGRKLGFVTATTDEEQVLQNPDVQCVFIVTRHHQHARQVIAAIGAGKHVFVEKPLCLNAQELDDIEQALADAGTTAPLLMVGFNRRFAPAATLIRQHFEDVITPLTVSIRFNAGAIPADHWTQDATIGGGRIIGEACHAIDLATFLTGSCPVRVFAESISGPTAPQMTDDQCFITLRHANGSVSSIAYLAGGDAAYPKERVEVFGGGRIGVIDDFRVATTIKNGRKDTRKTMRRKGHAEEIEAWAQALCQTGQPPITWAELRAVSRASIGAVQSLREGFPIEL